MLVLLFAAAVLSLLVGAVVFARGYRRLENSAFFVLSIGIASWSIGIAGFNMTSDPVHALAWAKFYYFAPMLIVVASAVFIQRFLYKTSLSPLVTQTIAGIGLAFTALLVVKQDFITAEIVTRDYGKQVILGTQEYFAYGLYLVAVFILVIAVAYLKTKRSSQQLVRQQANIFLYGFVVSCTIGLFFNLILPGFGEYRYIAIGPISTTILIIAIAYSIVRHKLFDIRLVIARAVGYTASLIILALVYGFLVFGIAQLLFGLELSIAMQAFLSIATAFAGLTFSRLKPFFDRITNRIFYRDAYKPQDLFDHLNKVLVSTVDLNQLLDRSANSIADNLRLQSCAIALRNEQDKFVRIIGPQKNNVSPDDLAQIHRYLKRIRHTVISADYLEEQDADLKALFTKNDISVIVQLDTNVKRKSDDLGYIILGARKSGNPYTQQDFKVLDTIAKEMIIAIQNALRVEEIENFNTSLQAKIDEATRKLRRSNEKLKALDEAKDDFVSMASHQLRTPLTSIKGYISMVLEGDAGEINDIQRKLLEQSFASSQRMVFLIADLLNVSRLKTGKFVIEEMPVNLAETVGSEIEQLQTTAGGRQLTLKYEQPKVFPTLLLDENKTRQVIMNLVDNAIYYTPAGGTVEVSVKETPSAVEFRVKDNGIGVPRSERPHLFTKFYRAGNARKARPDGTGLGLFMAKKVVVSQGGSIIFETEEGKGSTFGFIFPKSKMVPGTTQAVKA